jgi:hypothetical protein
VAYTAVKLADVQKAIAAVTAANKKYTDAQASSKTTETAVNNARKALETAQSKLQALQSDFDNQKYLTTNAGYKTANTALTAAEKKLNDARSFLDSGQFLEKNSAYQNALKAIQTAEKNRDAAQTRLDNATDRTRASLERALTAANKTVDTAYTNADRARAAAEKLAQTAITTAEKAYDTSNANLEKARVAAEKAAYVPIANQQKLVDTSQSTFDKTQEKYQGLLDSFQPLLDQRNEAINNVSSYVDTIRGSLGDVTKFADAKQVQTLLGQIQTAVKGTKLDDLIKPVTSMISQIDPLKMAAIPKVNIQGANPDAFSNIDPNTGLPILDQGGLDAVLDRYKSNKIDTQQYRDNWNKFGWNVKSDASTAMRGPAIVGLDMGYIQQGMGGGSPGIVRAGTREAASDADFKKAADQLGININDYYTTKEFSGAYGTKSTQKVLDRQSLYNDIADRTKDFYMVANSIDGDKHAALLFRADGSGNLVPVTNEQGAPMANYYTATRNVTGETWYGDLLPIAAIAASFALPGLSSALAGQIATATGLSATGGALVAANAALGAGMSAITGGDPIKGAIMAGAGTYATQNPGQITKALNISDAAINNIASVVKLDPNEVKTIIANGVSTTVAGGVTGSKNLAQDVIANVAGNFASAEAKQVVAKNLSNLDDKQLTAAADIAGNVANLAGNALVTGQDLSKVLNAAAPSILASGISAANQPVPAEIEERIFSQKIQGTPATIDDLKDEILKTIKGEKLEVAQAMPVTAEQIGQLARSQSANLAEKFGQWAANDPRFARLVSSPESVQMLKAAGLSELATLASTLGVVGAGGAAATAAGTGVLAAPGSEELRKAMLENPMLGALGGDASFAAALVDNYVNAQQAQQAKPFVPGEGGTLPAVVVTADRIPTPVAEFFQRSGTSYLQYENLANNLYKNVGVAPTPAQIQNLTSELISNAMQSPQTAGQPAAQPAAQPSAQTVPGAQPIVRPGTGQIITQAGLAPGASQPGVSQPVPQQPGGLQQASGSQLTPDQTLTQPVDEEAAKEEAAQKEAALQQYMQRIRTQQQQKTQELVDPKSVYYLTPEEQAARGYINPAELYESITPFKRGGLASMKRNAKWQH